MELPAITFSKHCLERYLDRVRGGGGDVDVDDDVTGARRARAWRELTQLLLNGAEIRAEPPPGMTASPTGPCDGWLWLSPDGDLAAPLVEKPGGRYVAASLYVKGGLSDLARQHRTQTKKYDKQSRAAAKRPRHGPGRRRLEPRVDEW